MKHIKQLIIDIDKKNNETIQSVQYDNNTRFIHINLISNSIPFDVTGCSVKISGTKPDGTAIFNNCTVVNAKQGFIEVELTEQINAIEGLVKCELKLYKGTGVLTTKQFNIYVTASVTSRAIVSSNEFRALTDALNKVQNIDNRFDELQEHCTGGNAMQEHSHINKTILDKFSEEEGKLCYNSEKIEGEIKDGSISVSKLSFANEISEYKDGYRLAKNGDSGYSSSEYLEVEEEGMSISDYIYLEGVTGTWQFSNIYRIAFFREDKSLISYLYDNNAPSSVNLVNSFSSLASTKYIKICCETSKKLDVEVIVQGVNVGAYNFEMPSLTLTNEQINKCISNFEIDEVDVCKIKQFKMVNEPSLNLFNKDNMITGSWRLGQEGIVFDASHKNSTGFIECKPNTIYTKTGVAHNGAESSCPPIYMFDENYDPISEIRTLGTFTTPSNARYMSGYLDTSSSNYREYPLGWHPNNYMIVEGDTLPLEYQEYSPMTYKLDGLQIDESNLSKNLLGELSKEVFNNNKDTNIVFKKNKDFNSTHFRIPFMCVTNLGTIIAGCDIRYNTWNDHSLIDIGTARSEDGGKTWIDKTVAIPNPGISSTLSRTMDGTILATKEGRVFLIGNKFNNASTGWTNVNTPNDPNWDIVLYHSDDDGRTWEFNQSLKSLLPSGQISFLGGVGSGIQMKDGTLVFPIQMARANDNPFNCQSGIIYSTDNGETWTMGETLVNEYTSECSVVEYPTGTIMINCRQEGQNHRSIYKTTNFGTTWEETPMNSNTQQTNACQGHMCKIKVGFDKEVILFTNPINDGTNREDGAYSGYDRSNLSLSMLQNDTKFTPIYTLYRPHSDGYSCMAFDERRNRLYVVMELEYNLVFKDITDLLPTIQMYKNLEDN